MEHQKIAPPELKNKQRLWITKEKVSYGQSWTPHSAQPNRRQCFTTYPGYQFYFLLNTCMTMYVWLYATIGFKQNKTKSKGKICKRILKDCQDAGYYMQLCSLFVYFFFRWNSQGHASGRNPSPPELIDSPAKGTKNLAVALFLHFTLRC